MKVIVDTCVWSIALRHNKNNIQDEKIISDFKKLIDDARVQMIGFIRQEILSGISSLEQFKKLKNHLDYFPDFPVQTKDHELAAEYFNHCRAKGIQGSHIDYLICAVSTNNKLSILTMDNDFKSYAKCIPILLYEG